MTWEPWIHSFFRVSLASLNFLLMVVLALPLARAQLRALLERGVVMGTNTWRPLLHAAAVGGEVAIFLVGGADHPRGVAASFDFVLPQVVLEFG